MSTLENGENGTVNIMKDVQRRRGTGRVGDDVEFVIFYVDLE